MNLRLLIYTMCAILGAIAVPLMFGLIPPNHTVGIRISATLNSPLVWYVVHGVVGWAVFCGAAALAYWLKRHPDAGRTSPLALMLLALSLLAGFMLG